jgi:hypothetical protein
LKFLLFVFLFVFIACGSEPDAPEPSPERTPDPRIVGTPAPAPTPTVAPVATPDPNAMFVPSPHLRGEPLRIILGYPSGGNRGFDTVNAILREAGINVEVIPHMPQANYNHYGTLLNMYRTSESDREVYVVPSGWNLNPLAAEELLQNFARTAQGSAPRYTQRLRTTRYAGSIENESLLVLPTNFVQSLPNLPAVLVREDIATAYGREIRTASEYIALLEWLKERTPAEIPSVIVANWRGEGRFFPYELFMPELGYATMPFLNNMLVLNIETRESVAAFALPQTRAMLQTWADLSRNRLMDFRNATWHRNTDFNPYPTLLIYANDFVTEDLNFGVVGFNHFNAGGYRMYILYNGEVPHISFFEEFQDGFQAPSVAFAKPGTDIAEFYRLLEWLENSDNYLRLMYGVENIHYEYRNGILYEIPGAIDWTAIRSNLFYFARSAFNIPTERLPSNYAQEIEGISYRYTVTVGDAAVSPLMNLNTFFQENGLTASQILNGQNNIFTRLTLFEIAPPGVPFTEDLINAQVSLVNNNAVFLQTIAGYIDEMIKISSQ